MLSEERIAEIKKRCEMATEGPWEWVAEDDTTITLATKDKHEFGFVTWAHRCRACVDRGNGRCYWPSNEDCDFIAHARTDVPALLAEVERLKAEQKECAR